jgi:phosphohistidine phosphatase
MAREIWFLRHGQAESHGARPDEERRLTHRGERQSTAAGRALDRLGIEFALVLTSPRTRALDTARLACEEIGAESVVHAPLSRAFGREDADALVAGVDDGGRLLVVGHEPDFSQTIQDLTGARVKLKKGGLAAVRTGDGSPELLLLMQPAELAALAERG